jgi:Xaa-Pro aminopeptidase
VTLRGIPYGHVTELKRLLSEADLVEFGPSFNRIRRIRSEEELIYHRRSGFLTDLACIALEQRLHPGMNEQGILGVIYDAYLKHGGHPGIHFIASTRMDEPDRFVPWQRNRKRVLETGSVVIPKLTVSYWGSTQIHRPIVVGREPSALYRKLFDVALECYENVKSICRPGVTSEELIAATSVIEQNGFTTYDGVFPRRSGKGARIRDTKPRSSLGTMDLNRKHGSRHPAQPDHPRPQSSIATRCRGAVETDRRRGIT